MILQLKQRNGKTLVCGGDIVFTVGEGMWLTVYYKDKTLCSKLKDYPTYSVGGNFVYCEELGAKEEAYEED